jgi:hypothetical protein
MTITQSSTRLLALALGAAAIVVASYAVLATPAHAATCPALTRSLSMGSKGADVQALQVFLNSSAATQIAASGAGSPGMESTYFGGLTKAAVIKFQKANGVSPIGTVGPATRAAIAKVCGGTTTGGTTTGGTTTGGTGAINVSAGTQPVNNLAPKGASRVPFTTFTLTNNSGAAVTVSSVTVQRAGLAQDAAFSGVVLLDSNGLQIGNAKTFNSNHQANIGDTGFTLAAGASMTFTVAGNMAADETSYSGQVAQISVVAINTTATVGGSLPIVGASQTINNTLTVGGFSTSTSSVVPPTGTSHTQNIGDVGVRFAGVKFTANSAEDLKLYSVRWRQVGSASNVDISNVVSNANGTTYPTTVDSTGKYYTTVFPGGILIPKGNSLDIYVQGDITGSNSSSRTVQFTVDRATDVYFVGQLYGFGIADTKYPNSQPWYNGDSFTINAGTASTISKSVQSADAAQNIAVNVPNVAFGGFTTNFLGEPVTISGMTLGVSSTTVGTAVATPLTSVSIVNENGAVISGPVDENSAGNLVFTDSVTFPTGVHTFHVKGKVASGVGNGSTFYMTVNPAGNWTNPTGQVTGSNVSLASNTSFNLNTMTVQGATTTIAVSSTPAPQNVVAGATALTLANIQIDATQSGEDIRLSSLPLSLTATASTDINSCQLFDGTTALTTGSRVINTPSTSAANTFTFDNSLVVPKGTVKTLSVACNLVSGATSGHTIAWGINSSYSYSATGVTSGVGITPTVTTAAGNTMTVQSGSLTVTAASSAVAQPALALAADGTTGVTIGQIKFHASNEALNLSKVGLTLASGTYGSKATGAGGSSNSGTGDVVQVYLYNGSTLVGTATFTGSTQTATSTLSAPITLAKDADTYLTVKADLSALGVSAAGGIGDTITVDPLNAEATGASSGQTVKVGATAGVNGVKLVGSVPTVAAGAVTSCTNNNSCNGSTQIVKTFTVGASAGGAVSVEQIKLAIATSSATLQNVFIKVLDGSGNVATSTFGTTQCSSGSCINAPTLTFTGGPVIVPASSTYTFQVIGDVASSNTTWSVTVKLNTDAASVANLTSGYNAATSSIANSDTNSRFIWSDNATTTAGLLDVDWFNGYQVFSSAI